MSTAPIVVGPVKWSEYSFSVRAVPPRCWGLAVLSAMLQVLPFPIAGPVAAWRCAFAWVALTPLLAALSSRSTEGGRLTTSQGALLGYLCGFLWYAVNCNWIYQTMYLYGGLARPVAAGILILFCLYLGLYHALFGAVFAAAQRSRFGTQGALLLAPLAWVAVELARSRITGLPWDLLGITQVDNALLTRIAPFAGAYGLSFVVACVNALWLVRLSVPDRRYTRPALTFTGVALVLVYAFGLRHLGQRQPAAATATATLLQENLAVGAAAETAPQLSTSEMLKEFSALTLTPSTHLLAGIPELSGTPPVTLIRRHLDRSGDEQESIAAQTDLIVWPESPASFEERDPQFREALSSLARRAGAPVIVDNVGVDRSSDPENRRGYNIFNSASLVHADGTFAGRYDKMHLVPFGEYVPYQQLFFFAGNLLRNVGRFEPGQRRTVFSSGGHWYGAFICYESIFGDEIRQFTRDGAELLVNLSDDGWYGDTGAPWQHLNMVRMRAIENHRWVVRATNTGVTAAINPYGRVTAAAPRHVRTAIQVGFGYEHDLTFYVRHGDLFAYLCSLLTVFALAYALYDSAHRLRLESRNVDRP